MKKVKAYWGKRQTTPKACPLGKRACFVDYRCCEHYHVGSRPTDGRSVGPCFVNCSAPVKPAKK